MLGSISLTGRTPYRLEYSYSLYKKSNKYKNPYGVIYSLPYENSFLPDFRQGEFRVTTAKVSRLLSEYSFYSKFKSQPLVQIDLNMVF